MSYVFGKKDMRVGDWMERGVNYEILDWSSESPTQEGIYWTFLQGGTSEIVRVAPERFIHHRKPELVIFTVEEGRMNEEPQFLSDYQKYNPHWLGPLPVPEAPKG